MRIGILLCLMLAPSPIYASTLLNLQVSDFNDRPLTGVIVSTKVGGSASAPTDIAGKPQIAIADDVQPGSSVALILVKAKSAKLRFFSPWEGVAIMPRPNEPILIILGSLGDVGSLHNAAVVGTLADAITQRARLGGDDSHASLSQQLNSLKSVSDECGLDAEAVDKAIRKLAKQLGSFEGSNSVNMKSADGYVGVMPNEIDLLITLREGKA